MEFLAFIDTRQGNHSVKVKSKGLIKELNIDSGTNGYGSAINGAEFLSLSIATCFCNDLYREANKKGITIDRIEIKVSSHFYKEGEPGENFTYQVKIESDSPKHELDDLIRTTDNVAEIHNTLRKGVEVRLVQDII